MKVKSAAPGLVALLALSLTIAAFGLLSLPVAQAATSPQLQVLQSDSDHIVVELSTPGYDAREQIVGATTYSVLGVPGFGNTGEVGKPQLPIKGTLIGIPPGAGATLQVIADQSSSVPLDHPPLPVPSIRVQIDPKKLVPTNQVKSFIPDAGAYSSNGLYPAEAAVISSISSWRSQHVAAIEFRPFQYNAATRQLLFHQRLRIQINLTYSGGLTSQALGSSVDEGAFDKVFQKSLANYSSARNWRSGNRAALSPQGEAPAFYSGTPWYKVGVDKDGIYQVTCGQIAKAAGKALNIAPSKLQLFKNGQEAAIKVVGSTWGTCTGADSNDYVEFYGQAPTSKYANSNIYWLTYGKATGKRMPAADYTGTGAASIASSFTATLHLEENHLYVSYVALVDGADHWFWDYTGPGKPSSTFLFPLQNLAAGTFAATLQSDVAPATTSGHHTQLLMNGNLVGDAIWSGHDQKKLSFDFPGSYLVQGNNTLDLVEPTDQDPNDSIAVNNFDLEYRSAFMAGGDVLSFNETDSGIWRFQIGGFSSSSLEAYDITNPLNVAKFNSLTITPNSPPYKLSFKDSINSPHRYIALASSQRLTPSVTFDTPSSLHATTNGADYIVISYGGFINNIMPLANFRQGQGMRVKVVDVQDVFDEFGDGLPDPQAIHDFLAFAYANWKPPAPSFVLLVGDGHYDPKGYCIPPATCLFVVTTPDTEFIPPNLLMVDPQGLGETDSDNRLVAFNPNDTLPDMAIGRLPADSTADVDAMVAKILAYEQNPPAGTWQTKVTFVADQPDPTAGDFWQQSDLVALNPTYMPSQYTANRIYYPNPPYSDPTSAHQAVVQAVNNGTLIANFTGHAFYYYWANVGLLHRDDIPSLTNGGKTPVMVEMTCLTGYSVIPNVPSLAEVNLRRAGGGAVASWSATGEGISTGHYLMDEGFFNAVMQQGVYQLGPATILGKANLWANSGGAFHDLVDTFQLFGDPATRLLAAHTDVAISKTVSSTGPLVNGSPITFTLSFSNNGAGRAEKVVITDILPSGIISPSYNSSGAAISPTGSKPYVWNVGSLDPGAGGVITITARLDPNPANYASMALTNTATISTPTLETNTTNNTSTTVTQAVVKLFLPFLLR